MKKMSLANIKESMSREEMKKILAGSSVDGCGVCYNSDGWKLPCWAIGGPWGCMCTTFNSNNICG